MSSLSWRFQILLVALIAAGAAGLWFGLAPDQAASPLALAASPAVPDGAPAVPVTEGRAETRDVPIWLSGIGSVQPLNAVTVKVRVDGQLDRVAFTEGQDVNKGDVVAQIDPRSYRAQLKQAQANKAKDEAQLTNARLDLERSTRLEAKGVASKQSLDTQRAQVTVLESTIEADQSAIEMAQLQLEFSTITAPLSGRTGLRLVDPGTVVHASDANGIVTITKMQPIAVLFTVPQDELPDVLAATARGEPVVVAYSRGGERPLATGKLIFVDSQVDQGTGHVKLKALFDNSNRALWPGEFVDARVQVATVNAATVVPSKAIERGQNGTYVFRVKPDDTVEVCPVTVRHVGEGTTIIADGVAPGDRIIVDGQYRLQAGARIEPRKPAEAGGS
jgi:multidrug efflux system membrane fusion protein